MAKYRYEVRGQDFVGHTDEYLYALLMVLDHAGVRTFEGWDIDTSSPTSCFRDPANNVWQITTLD